LPNTAIELCVAIEVMRIDHPGVDAGGARRFDHLGADVDSDRPAPVRDRSTGESALAAAEVEYALAGPRCEEIRHRFAGIGDEPGVGRGLPWIPVLPGGAHDSPSQ
jgi:hypothetical protein